MKIVSFGDSFVFGTEIPDNISGDKSWIGLAAKKLGVDYETLAVAGCGNDHIARQIYSYFSENSVEDTLAIINWTWASRWDFHMLGEFAEKIDKHDFSSESEYSTFAGESWPSFADYVQRKNLTAKVAKEIDAVLESLSHTTVNDKWFTLGPTCVPKKLEWINNDSKAIEILNFYNEFLQHSVLWNNIRSLQTISSAQNYLNTKGVKNIQTYMDYELFTTDELLSPKYISELQKQVKPNLSLFHEDLNFLDWARSMNFAITASPGDHPLAEAHQAAADLWLDRYKEKLFN